VSRAARLFGTDGIRGPAGEGPLSPESVLALGRAAAAAVRAGRPRGAPPPRVLIGRDTRPSGPMVTGALAAGLQAGGVAVEDGGVLPTPAVALLVRRRRFDLGAAVSASHNPAPDNGVKFLGSDGEKAGDALERAIEEGIPAARRPARAGAAAPAPGRIRADAAEEYGAAILGEFRGLSLRGVRVVVDGAEGAGGAVAPAVLLRLGAEVHPVRCGGNGARINDGCGALHPETAARAVRKHKAQVGIALDGDADRVTLLDEDGRRRDGDDLLAGLAPRLRARGRLPGAAVVGTVMANGGLDAHLQRHGIALVRTSVGDRAVAAAIREHGLALGAEPSGHLLLPRGGLLTSDGLLTALLVLREMVRAGAPLSAVLPGFPRVPRAEAAVAVARKPPLDRVPAIRVALAAAESVAGPRGRVLLRYSGTEPRARILVESPSRAAAESACATLARAISQSLGPKRAEE